MADMVADMVAGVVAGVVADMVAGVVAGVVADMVDQVETNILLGPVETSSLMIQLLTQQLLIFFLFCRTDWSSYDKGCSFVVIVRETIFKGH